VPFSKGSRLAAFEGLATAIYHVRDLDRAKAWYTAAFQQAPYTSWPLARRCCGLRSDVGEGITVSP
jgi:hypothetical protein